MSINEVIVAPKFLKYPRALSLPKIAAFIIVLLAIIWGVFKYTAYITDKNKTLAIITNPKINDIYFLDYRLLSDDLRPKEKYRIAKIVDITGDIVTLLYGDFFYQHQHAAINSIQYGQLSYKDYFQPKRYNLSHNVIKQMHQSHAIYQAERPIRNKLFGNLVGPEKLNEGGGYYIYGKKENISGEAFLKVKFSESNLETAFEFFQHSSELGYAKGQVNLAQMYINGQFVKKDFAKALFWLKQASLQSYKPAILKYGIICEQVSDCNIVDFYQELTDAGVNIKVRKLDFKLDN